MIERHESKEGLHQPVLLQEVLDLLQIKEGGRYVDGTLGLGGHAEGILRKLGSNGTLLGIDVDPDNLKQAKDRLQPFEDQTITRRVNFRGLQGILQELGWETVHGMVFDLGVSSTQLGAPLRGFSFQRKGPLDMRLDPDSKETAQTLLRKIEERELSAMLWEFGEKRNARRISRYLLNDIQSGRIQNTEDLAKFCERVIGRYGKVHPATRVFLALRCLVNKEIETLQEMLRVAPPLLSVGGRIAVISFHSLEDKQVKSQFRFLAKLESGPYRYSLVTKKPIRPTIQEQEENPRSRSAKLRVLERIQ